MKNKELIKKVEGNMQFFIYDADKDTIPSKSMKVFYNKKMIINRDITSLVAGAYSKIYPQESLVVVDSMAASGIGALRLVNENKNVKQLYINDINPVAVELIKKNLKFNNINGVKIKVSQKDANLLFSELTQKLQKKPNVISIDPFGTPNKYIDGALKVIQKKNGLLCITATDTPVLFGIKQKACIRKYMSKSLHTEYCKEIGARILLYFVARMANINGLAIIPLLTFYSNHFLRIFVLTSKQNKVITRGFSHYGYIIHCGKCGYRTSVSNNILQLTIRCPLCEEAESLDYAGPLWIKQLHDPKFLEQVVILNEKNNYPFKKKIQKLVGYALNEDKLPLSYYNLHKICQQLKLPLIPKIHEIIDFIKKKGFNASRTHFDFLSIKTDLDINQLKNVLIEMTN